MPRRGESKLDEWAPRAPGDDRAKSALAAPQQLGFVGCAAVAVAGSAIRMAPTASVRMDRFNMELYLPRV